MKSTVEIIRQQHPELWSFYGQSMIQDMQRCMASLVEQSPATQPDPCVVVERLESVVEMNTTRLLAHAALKRGFTAACVMQDTSFGTIVFYHELPLFQRRNDCCVHIGVVHMGPKAADVWFCPHTDMFHIVTIEGGWSVPRDDVVSSEGPLNFTLRAAERVIQKRPELLAQPTENGYLN